MNGLLFDAAATATAAATNTGTSVEGMNQFMAGFTILIGLFAIYSAITGKGPAFKNEYPKVMQADAQKMMRIFCAIIGPIVTVFGVLDYMQAQWGTGWAVWVSMGIVLPAIVVYAIMFRRKFGKYLK